MADNQPTGRPRSASKGRVWGSRCGLATALLVVAACGGGGRGGGGGGESAAPATSAPPPQTTVPAPSWTLERTPPADLEVDAASVDAVLDYIFTDAAVQSAVLVDRGHVIGERYAEGYDAGSYGTSWSVAKSIYSAAIGVAVDAGAITSVEQRASELLTEWEGTEKADITVRNMLEMRAGMPADVGIFSQEDQTAFALDLGLVNEPGTRFLYSNANSQLMGLLIQRATGADAHTYVSEKIFEPIGIDPTTVGLWLDPTGTNPLTYCCIDMRPDDFARFGLLYSRGGQWDGARVLSEGYIDESLTAHSAVYGFQWWVLNQAFLDRASPPPIDVVAALGLDGQKIYVWRDEDVVLVVLTRYEHFRNQGYVLSLDNWPNTCSGRNTCPGSQGPEIPSYSERVLIDRLADLR